MPSSGLGGCTWLVLALSSALTGCFLQRTPLEPADAAVHDSGARDASRRDAPLPHDAGPPPDDAAGDACSRNGEICNGEDDDCDGRADEDIAPVGCSSMCTEVAQARCVDGAMVCDALQPAEERCNSLDDDCDGRIDEALFRGCTTACGAGRAKCSGGLWGACAADLAMDEICNGEDEDCDGRIDEGVTRPCEGTCGGGIEACDMGAFGECSAAPEDELCNAYDDDCDGNIDEGDVCPCDLLTGPAGRPHLFCNLDADWASAHSYCQTRGYSLVTIRDADHNTFVTTEALALSDLDWWIGYNDRTTEGTWTWVSGVSSSYENFHPSQPNSSLGEQDCATLDNGSQEGEGRGQWGDRDCSSAFAFVCHAP